MNLNKKGKFLFTLLLSLILMSYLSAQQGRGKGRINGIVQDEAGAVIENAKIRVTSLDYENVNFEATTDEKGEWSILGLGTGMWRVMASADGYRPSYTDITVKQLERNPEVIVALKKIERSEQPIIQDESSFSLFEQGNQLFIEKKYEEALAYYEQFLQKNPKAYQIHLNIGNCYKEKGQFDKANQEYNKVLEEAKRENEDLTGNEIAARALAAIGECYLKTEDLENAQKYFKESIDIYPKDESLAYNVGELFFSNNKIDEAIQYFELAKQIKSDWGKPYLKLGYAYLNKGNYEEAKINLKKFLELEPESPEGPNVQNIINFLEKKEQSSSQL